MGWVALLGIVVVWLVGWGVASLPGARRRWPGMRGETGAVGILIVLWLLFFWRVWFEKGVAVPKGGGDFNSFSYPLSAFAAGQIQAGHFPLWNPHLFAGMPFAANYLSGALYPPNLFVWAVARPFTYGAFEAVILVHFLWASVAAYGFARTLGVRRIAALVVGVTFAYGWLPPQLGHAQMAAAVAWIPAVLAALYRGRNGGIGWTVLAALALTMQLLAGHPQTSLYTLTVAVAYVLFLAWRGSNARRATSDEQRAATQTSGVRAFLAHRSSLVAFWAKVGVRLVVLLGVMGGLAAPLILPATQLSRRSVRAGIGYDSATQFSVHPFTLLQLLVPKVFGDNPTNYYYSQFFSGETWGYAGVVTLVLAAVGLAWRGHAARGQQVFFAAVGVVALLGALGPFTPLHGWLYAFAPGYDKIRAAGRLFMWYGLAVALLAGWGVDALLGNEQRAMSNEVGNSVLSSSRDTQSSVFPRTRRVLLGAVAVLVAFVIPLFYSLVFQKDDPVSRPVIALDGFNVLVLYLLGAALLIWLAERRSVGPRALGALAVALVVLDLFSATSGFNPTADNLLAGYAQPDARAELRVRAARDPLFRVDTDDVSDRWQPDTAVLDGVDSVSGVYDPLELADYANLRERAQSSRSSALYGLLNVAYVAQPAEKPAPVGWTKAFAGDKVNFYQPSRPPLPRAFVVGNAAAVPDPGVAFDRIKAPDFDPTKVVYIQGASQPAIDPGASPATVMRDGTDGLSVQVSTTGPGYLVVSEAYYPGWIATVDGASAPILQADLAFRAVYLPNGGDHTIVFRFQPRWWSVGWLLAAFTAVATLLLLVIPPLIGGRKRNAKVQRRKNAGEQGNERNRSIR